MRNAEGGRRGSNPRPSLEPQSADIGCHVLLQVAKSAYQSQIAPMATTSNDGQNTLGGVPVVYMVYRKNRPDA
jgi:hypothetical protein